MINTNAKLSNSALRNDSDGIYKAIKTSIDQYRDLGASNLLINEPESNDFTAYYSTIIAGVKVCEVIKYHNEVRVASYIAWID